MEPTIISRGLNLSLDSNSLNFEKKIRIGFKNLGNFAKIGIKNFSEIWYEEFLPEKFLILIPEKIPKLILEKFWNPIPENFLSQIPEKIPIPEKFFGIGYKKFPQN